MYVPGRTQGRREGNMKWVKNKVVASTSASRPFLISHVLPPSWLTRFKQMSLGSGQQRHATKPNPKSSIGRLNFNSSAPPFTSPNLDSGGGRGGERFYGGDDDAFWRLSFGYECEAYGDKKYVSEDDDDVKFPPSSCCARSNRVGCRTGEEEEEVEVLPAVDIRTPGLRSLSLEEKKEMKARRSNSKRQLGSEVVEAKKKQGRNAEAESAEVKQHRTASVWNSSSKAENMELVAEILSSAEWGELKDTRKSVHISGEPMQRKQSRQGRGKVRVGSPRTPETFKIRGTEEMKVRAKRKTKPPEKSEGFDWLKSFAVVKSSYDPQNDFTESMVEMIEEMGIRKAEELEELLACYLTLNSEEYHELIIKVFRQVWFHLNHVVVAAAAAYNHRDLS